MTTDAEHFGLLGCDRCSRRGVRVARSQHQAGRTSRRGWIEAEITPPHPPRCRLSHVLWTHGQVLPVERFAGRDFAVLVDGAQSCGAIASSTWPRWASTSTPSRARSGCSGRTEPGLSTSGRSGSTSSPSPCPRTTRSRATRKTGRSSRRRGRRGSTTARCRPGARRAASSRSRSPTRRVTSASSRLARPPRAAGRRSPRTSRSMAEPGESTLVAFRPEGDAAETVARLAEQWRGRARPAAAGLGASLDRLLDERRRRRPARRRRVETGRLSRYEPAAAPQPQLGSHRAQCGDDERDVLVELHAELLCAHGRPRHGGRRPRTTAASASCARTSARASRSRPAARTRRRRRSRRARRRRTASSSEACHAEWRGARHGTARASISSSGYPSSRRIGAPSCGCSSSVGWIS